MAIVKNTESKGPRYTYDGAPVFSVTEVMKQMLPNHLAGVEYDVIMAKGLTGTGAHNYAEAVIKHRGGPEVERARKAAPLASRGYIEGWQKWWMNYQSGYNVHVVGAEIKMVFPDIAGTLDLCLILQFRGKVKLVIVDYKVRAKKKIDEMQLAAYEVLIIRTMMKHHNRLSPLERAALRDAKENGAHKILLELRKDGTHKAHICETPRRKFEALLEVYWWGKEIGLYE